MNKKPWWTSFFSWWVLLGGFAFGAILLAVFWFGILYLRPAAQAKAAPTPLVYMVAAPTLTPVVQTPTPAATVTPTIEPSSAPPANDQIRKGSYVQIGGTDGAGLRLRSEPGTKSSALFLGMEAEVFHVEDGPQYLDGFTWWYLVAPYDSKRSGWAVSNYLLIIQNPGPSPTP